MVRFIRQHGLKFQMVFWMSLIAISLFMSLFGFSFWFYRQNITANQWELLQSVAKFGTRSILFDDMDDFIDSGVDSLGSAETLIQFCADLIEETGMDGIYLFYRKGDEIYLIRSVSEYRIPISSDDIPVGLVSACENIFYTGVPVKYSDAQFYYYIQPVIRATKYKYGLCVYLSTMSEDLDLMHYAMVSIASFLIAISILVTLVIYVTDRVLINPIVEIEKVVDSFVYQVSGGYAMFAYTEAHGNEITVLRNSVNRLEKMLTNHSKLLNESARYREWLKSNSGDETARIDYLMQSSKIDAFCDTETLAGNKISWEMKRNELDHLLAEETIDFLYMVYIRFTDKDNVNIGRFLDDVMHTIGIKGIPMDTIFRVSETDFVCLFGRKRLMDAVKSYVDGSDNSILVGTVALIPEVHHSAQDLIDVCLSQINSEIKTESSNG